MSRDAASLEEPPPPRRVPALDAATAAFVLSSGVYSLAMTQRDVRYFLAQGADDGAYYLGVSEHAARGLGYTFDGLAPTNGFHPLWAWILTAIDRIALLPPEFMIRLVWALQSLLMTGAAWILARLVQRTLGSWPAALAAVLFVGRLYYTGRGGMESALLLFLMAVLLDRAERWRPAGGPGRAVAVGVTAGLVMLARLDAVFVAGALVAGWALATPRVRGRSAVLVGAAATLTVLPYLLGNLRGFGHVVPISGMLKSSFPHAGWYVGTFSIEGQDLLVLVSATATGVLLLLSRLVPEREPAPWLVRVLLPALAAGALAHMLYSALFMKWGVFSWHFVLMRLVLALALPALGARLFAPRPGLPERAWAAGLVLVLLASALPVIKRDWRSDPNDAWTTQAYEAARWVQVNTPENTVIAMRDAGNFGYFSRRHVINTDGLVNSFAYQDSLAAGRFEGFLRSRGTTYFAHHAIYGRPDITAGDYESWTFDSYSHRFDRPGGSLTLRRADEVYRSRPYHDAGHLCVFLIWRMPAR